MLSESSSYPSPTPALLSALLSLRSTPPRLIQSPPTQPRRASVALIIRLKPPEGLDIPEYENGVGSTIEEFFRLPWVSHPLTTPQLLYIRRSTRPSDRFSSHIAFPGGRQEPGDDGAHYTALRETWEEIGIDLAEKEFITVGRLDDREITTSLGKRLLMILSPIVFLQTSPQSPIPDLQPTEVSSLHWIDIPSLIPPYSRNMWSSVEIDISSRLSPRNKVVRLILRGLVGSMKFGALLLPDEPDAVAEGFIPEFQDEKSSRGWGAGTLTTAGGRQLRLWGLTLGMTLDLLSHLPQGGATPLVRPLTLSDEIPSDPNITPRGYEIPTGFEPRTPVTVTSSFDEQWGVGSSTMQNRSPNANGAAASNGAQVDVHVATRGKGKEVNRMGVNGMQGVKRRGGVGPGMTSVFPRFSYVDINFFIWVFGRRYRSVVRGWEASMRGPPRAADRRINWSGAALSTFYAAVRQALVVAIVLRAIATGAALAGVSWYLWKRWGAA